MVEQQGPIAYLESTAAPEVFEEDANRCLVLQPDERPEQTRRILSVAGRQLAGRGADKQRKQMRQEFHCLQRLLTPANVVIPYSETLADLFPREPLEVRRAFGHVASMIQTSALLHQLQRDHDERGRIVAQPEDYWLDRVSSREQEREGFSLEVQEEALRRYATQNGGEIIKLFRIAETASKRDERKTFKEMVAFAKKRCLELDGLLFYKVDRAARNLVDYVELERLESEYDVPFISISQQTDSNPAGCMMRRTLANMASFFTEQMSVDIKQGCPVECKRAGSSVPLRMGIATSAVRVGASSRSIPSVLPTCDGCFISMPTKT